MTFGAVFNVNGVMSFYDMDMKLLYALVKTDAGIVYVAPMGDSSFFTIYLKGVKL